MQEAKTGEAVSERPTWRQRQELYQNNNKRKGENECGCLRSFLS